MTANIVPQIDEETAKNTMDRLMGGVGSFIKQCIIDGELTSAVVILSTSQGKVMASLFDRVLPQDAGTEPIIMSQADQIAVSNVATAVATTLANEAVAKTRTLVPTSEQQG